VCRQQWPPTIRLAIRQRRTGGSETAPCRTSGSGNGDKRLRPHRPADEGEVPEGEPWRRGTRRRAASTGRRTAVARSRAGASARRAADAVVPRRPSPRFRPRSPRRHTGERAPRSREQGRARHRNVDSALAERDRLISGDSKGSLCSSPRAHASRHLGQWAAGSRPRTSTSRPAPAKSCGVIEQPIRWPSAYRPSAPLQNGVETFLAGGVHRVHGRRDPSSPLRCPQSRWPNRRVGSPRPVAEPIPAAVATSSSSLPTATRPQRAAPIRACVLRESTPLTERL